MQVGSFSPSASVQQAIDGVRGSAAVSMLNKAFEAQQAIVEKLLSTPAPGTGTLVDKVV